MLISAPYFQPVVSRFADVFESHNIDLVIPRVNERLSEAELLQVIPDIHGAICGDDAFTDRVLAHAPVLRVVSKWGTGIDSIDQASCKKRGIAVCNTPNAFSEPVADTTLAYMLSHVRQSYAMTEHMRLGRWEKIPGRTLAECTIGLLGMGNIGKTVVKRLLGFSPRILACDPVRPPQNFLDSTRVEMVEKERLLAESDIVSLHCDLNPTSFHIIDRGALSLMRPTAFLINTARGPLVHEAALVEALESAKLAGAAMDVFEDEPLPASSPLMKMSNVLLAPHNSNSSPRAWEHVHNRTLQNLLAYFPKEGN